MMVGRRRSIIDADQHPYSTPSRMPVCGPPAVKYWYFWDLVLLASLVAQHEWLGFGQAVPINVFATPWAIINEPRINCVRRSRRWQDVEVVPWLWMQVPELCSLLSACGCANPLHVVCMLYLCHLWDCCVGPGMCVWGLWMCSSVCASLSLALSLSRALALSIDLFFYSPMASSANTAESMSHCCGADLGLAYRVCQTAQAAQMMCWRTIDSESPTRLADAMMSCLEHKKHQLCVIFSCPHFSISLFEYVWISGAQSHPLARPGTGTLTGCQVCHWQRWSGLHPIQHLLGAIGAGVLHPCLALHGASDVVWNLGAAVPWGKLDTPTASHNIRQRKLIAAWK